MWYNISMKKKNTKKGFIRKFKKLRPWARIALLVIFIGILGLGYKGVSGFLDSCDHDYFTQSQYAEGCEGEISPDCEEAICDFLNQFYYAQSQIPEGMEYYEYEQEAIDSYIPDMTVCFAKPGGSAAWLWQSSLRFLITARTISPVKLAIDDIHFDLEYLSVNQGENTCKVSFKESAQFRFAFMSDKVSESYKMPCEMKLKKVDGDWKIVSYYREDDFSTIAEGFYENLLASGYSKSKAAKGVFKKCMNYYIPLLEKKDTEMENANNGLVSYDDVTCDKSYDRETALEYAQKYVKERNSEKWGVYDEIGGNCQNFGSQVLYNGGIPMDVEGDALWKYYSDVIDETSANTGRTASWTGAPFFYNYAKTNKGFGLVATVDANLFTAEPGDILQVGPKKGEMTHTNVVVGTITNEEDQIVDVIINSNTNNRVNWPMYASLSKAYSLIKIHGANQ